MKPSQPVLVLLVAALLAAPAARAALPNPDQTPMFLHHVYDPAHCWVQQVVNSTGKAKPPAKALAAPALLPQSPGATAADASPGLSLLAQGISPVAPPDWDPQLAVSPHYVLVLQAHNYVFYDRSTRQPLVPDGCVPLNDTFTHLFAPLLLPFEPPAWQQSNPADVNDRLDFAAEGDTTPSLSCDREHWNDAGSACVQEVYDARSTFDPATGRFWIVAAARNLIWQDHGFPIGDKRRRYVFVAVSKAEDPRQGFWEYVLVRDYADWPLFAVANGHLVIGHNGGRRVYVFDAERLANPGKAGSPFQGRYGEQDFAEAKFVAPVTQVSNAQNLNVLLGASGKNLTVYVFRDPARPLVKATQELATAPYWTMQPVALDNRLYFAGDPCFQAVCSRQYFEVHRVTAEINGDSLAVSAITDEHWPLEHDGAALHMPGVLVGRDGSFIAWYQAFPDGKPPGARYQVFYPNEFAFRHGALLRTSEHNEQATFVGDEQLGGAVDPQDSRFWLTAYYADSTDAKQQAVGTIEPGCGTLTPCGAGCFDLSANDSNCGACGHACTDPQRCIQGRCKTLKCPPCHCLGGFTAGVCADSEACQHICHAHEPGHP